MGARELLRDLAGAGFTVAADACKLVVAPASRLTDELRARIRAGKADLLALLTASDAAATLAAAGPDPRPRCIAPCLHYRPSAHRCAAGRRAGLATHHVGPELAGLHQRCPAHQPAAGSPDRPAARDPAAADTNPYRGAELRAWGDPAAESGTQSRVRLLARQGLPWVCCIGLAW